MKELFLRYSADHQNTINKMIHLICVPLIYWAVIGLLWSIPFLSETHGLLNWSTLIIGVVLAAYYLPKSITSFIAMIVLSVLGFGLFYWIESQGWPVGWIAAAMFLIGWVGQFIGHYFEGAKPSFFDELQFLLVGPAWVMESYFSIIGLGQMDKTEYNR